MCNRYANTIAYSQYVEAFTQLGIPLVSPAGAPNLEPQENIAPTNSAPILRPLDDGVELCRLRWGLIPWFHKKGVKEWKMLTTNARYEGLTTSRTFKHAFEKRRCLVPLSHFYEWTGEKGHKTKWSFSRKDDAWFCFAGLWDRADTSEGTVESYALLTTAAGPDVAPYHNRQPVILERSAYRAWMGTGALPASAIKPLQTGLLKVEQASLDETRRLVMLRD
jgi:putative SOS response-associated peptidase YedK